MDITELLRIPDLEGAKRLLCVQPHPDDNEVGAGATIAKLADKGCEVIFLTVTDGSKGTADPSVSAEELMARRCAEAQAAGELLGVREQIFLDYVDGETPDATVLRGPIMEQIRKVKPDFVLTVDPWLPYEAHQDHRHVGLAVAEAVLGAGNIHYLKDGPEPWAVTALVFHSTTKPNTFIDVDGYWERKVEAIRAHESQFSDADWQFLGMYFDYKARAYAEGRDCERAEAFKVLPPITLHMSVDTVDY